MLWLMPFLRRFGHRRFWRRWPQQSTDLADLVIEQLVLQRPSPMLVRPRRRSYLLYVGRRSSAQVRKLPWLKDL